LLSLPRRCVDVVCCVFVLNCFVLFVEQVAQTLEELTELQDDPSVGDDELALLAEESNKQQRDLLLLAKDANNFNDDDFFNEF
jgi:hypothetical protein